MEIQLWLIALSLFAIAVYYTAGNIPWKKKNEKTDTDKLNNNKAQSEFEAQTKRKSTSKKSDTE